MSEIVFLVYTPFGKGRYFGIVFFCCVKESRDSDCNTKAVSLNRFP